MKDRDFNSLYNKLFADIAAAPKALPIKPITFSSARKGNAYSGDLMWVGRALNGWTESWLPSDFTSPDKLAAAVRMATDEQAPPGTCPLQWIQDTWRNESDYNSARSAFWRCAKAVVTTISSSSITGENWQSFLVWSNLYKVAPKEGGNPSSTLATIQRPACKQLLAAEIAHFRPKHLVLATGVDWAAEFLNLPCFSVRALERQYQNVEGRGDLTVNGQKIGTYVVAKHPQGKKEQEWQREVCEVLG